MKESNNYGELVRNLVKTEKGTHCLYRAYGLSNTDSLTILTRSTVQNEVSRWYPSVVVTTCTCTQANEQGHFEYNLEVEG